MGVAEGVLRLCTRSCSFAFVYISIKTMGVPNPCLEVTERRQGQSFASPMSSYLPKHIGICICM